MPKFRCVVATPTREMFLGDVESAKIPGAEGYFGVLAGHENYVGINGCGLVTLTLDAAGKDKKQFLVDGGFAQMMNNHLAILPRFGHAVEDLTLDHANEQIERIQKELDELDAGEKRDEAQIETLNARLSWYKTQIKYLNNELL